MTRNKLLANFVLKPLSVAYGWVTGIRNLFFRWGILEEHSFDVPLIVVGNLAVGGTGKTPHTEMVVELMRHKYKVAVLSRGYKRSTKGFILASPQSTPGTIGDEPYQIYHKFSGTVPVAVCESRVKGVQELQRLLPDVNLIVLDDAFQHRYIKPTVSIVLTEFDRPAYEDHLLPYGRLRESYKSMSRADIVIVSKCPAEMKPLDIRLKTEKLKLRPYQSLYYSSFAYQRLKPVFPDMVSEENRELRLDWLNREDAILALAGIANPKPFIRWLKSFAPIVKSKSYPDHYNFQRKDLEVIKRLHSALPGNGRKFIVTTEKDAVRLANNPYFPPELKPYIFYQPISVKIVLGEETPINQVIESKIKKSVKKHYN
ncbi:MAG: tetraacyldisaccharide 4'-kinase [Muribaculaceae bacterium]|nr:tetraacyldisaccharide 4'-kinase [Muribaculaceae bacterium]